MSSVSEAEWLTVLGSAPTWNPPAQPILIVAPHPDDETLGAGGLIAAESLRGTDIVVAAVTDGEKAYADTGLAELRPVEQAHALARLGVPGSKIHRLHLPDGDVASHEQELIERLSPLISEGTHVIAPWTGDRHPDHEACGRAAQEVASRCGAMLTWYFFWTWHWGTSASLQGLLLRKFLLTPECLFAKTEALLCHQSQLFRPQGDPVLPELLLAPARRPFEIFALA